ncbi:hypothetical protein [Massilia sp. Root418]|uniref:hypothetical protein n=1 Tax=Massilia sp. Root418 TaxID=1736532 RepID=UPI0012F6384C|nr:hypothetical protein [Massilia sp. Root418]
MQQAANAFDGGDLNAGVRFGQPETQTLMWKSRVLSCTDRHSVRAWFKRFAQNRAATAPDERRENSQSAAQQKQPHSRHIGLVVGDVEDKRACLDCFGAKVGGAAPHRPDARKQLFQYYPHHELFVGPFVQTVDTVG